MPPNRLNLSALRRNDLPRAAPREPTLPELVTSPEPLSVSRRELLGLAGAAAVALPPGGKQLQSGMRGPFTFESARDRALFRLGKRPAWTIDTRLFAGSPRLRCREEDGLIALELTGARYPGTDLPADFACVIRRSMLGWRMRIKLAAGGFEAEVPFEAWLAGAEPARGRVEPLGPICPLGAEGKVEAAGGQACFRPDWTLEVEGRDVARLSGLKADLAGDALAVTLLTADAPSLLEVPASQRTLVTVKRGGAEWPLTDSIITPDGGRMQAEGSAFDLIEVETGEDGVRGLQALVARPGNGDARLAFVPGDGVRDLEQRPFALPLTRARYAVAFDGDGDEAALVADFADRPVWVNAGGLGLQVGGGQGTAPFEVVAQGGTVKSARCEPALLGLVAPLAGAIVEPAVAPEGTRVEFIADQYAQRPVPPRRPIIVRPPDEQPERPQPAPDARRTPDLRVQPDVRSHPDGTVIARPELLVGVELAKFLLPVLRPVDLLHLTYQFVNLKLETTGGPARLVRVKPDDPAYVIVHFPPQNIAEQAFFEADPDLAPGESETPSPPPVQTRMAGASRLVFEVPKATTEIPYTIDALLDWSGFDLSVAPTALPLPELPRLRRPAEQAPKVIPRPQATTGTTPGVVALAPGGATPLSNKVNLSRLAPEITVVGGASRFALPAGGLRLLVPKEPEPTETALELPYRLIVSPNATAGWVHSIKQVPRNQRIELWHTRLGVRSSDGTIHEDQYAYGWDDDFFRVVQVSSGTGMQDRLRTLRAIWSPDYAPQLPAPADVPFRMSMNPRDRCQLVWLTANYTISGCQTRVAHTKRLMLTSLGAWLDTRYAEEPPLEGPGLNLEEWVHRATMGRDHYVKIQEKGYLFPFGHRASLVKVTERKFVPAGSGSVAYLRQRFYILVREPVKTYEAPGQQYEGRRMPFRKVTLTTLITPALNKMEDSKVGLAGVAAQDCFWPRVGPDDFQFRMIGEDWDGETTEFTAPLIFVSAASDLAYKRDPMDEVCTHYNSATPVERIKRPVFGQKIALADTEGAKPGDTALEAESITFGAETDDEGQNLTVMALKEANQPCFYPTLAEAYVRIPAAAVVAGQAGATRVSIAEVYVQNKWRNGPNKGSVFAELRDTPGLNFPGDKGGGLALPNLMMSGLSRQFGPVGGDPAQMAGGNFNPQDFFKDAASTLLGDINLWDVIADVFGDTEVPGLTIDTEKDEWGVPTLVRAKYEWKPQVTDFGTLFVANRKGTPATFMMKVLLEQQLREPFDTVYDSQAELKNFTINLVCIGVVFEYLKFSAASGKKADVSPSISAVEFKGPLEFVNTLRKYLSEAVPGLSIDITPTGIYIGYALPIPSIAVGVMSIQNINLGIAFTLPFTGDPIRFRFAFCERHNPFILTVSIFGGGGFFALELTPSGLAMVEAALEFGGNFAFNIGVASGGAYLMAGVYFKYELAEQDGKQVGSTTLTGYVRCGGHLSVLGLITISCEFYLGLTYEKVGDSSRCYGQAKLTVEIEILFFSFSVTLSVEREFAGSGGGGTARLDEERLAALGGAAELARLGLFGANDGTRPPTIPQVLKPKDWKTYCEAFA